MVIGVENVEPLIKAGVIGKLGHVGQNDNPKRTLWLKHTIEDSDRIVVTESLEIRVGTGHLVVLINDIELLTLVLLDGGSWLVPIAATRLLLLQLLERIGLAIVRVPIDIPVATLDLLRQHIQKLKLPIVPKVNLLNQRISRLMMVELLKEIGLELSWVSLVPDGFKGTSVDIGPEVVVGQLRGLKLLKGGLGAILIGPIGPSLLLGNIHDSRGRRTNNLEMSLG